MECKFHIFWNKTKEIPELIDTLWNVNVSGNVFWGKDKDELIDTLWNVNTPFVSITKSVHLELIDTLWNVNFLHLESKFRSMGINRYIMECKLHFHRDYDSVFPELIDTLWNVNFVTNK